MLSTVTDVMDLDPDDPAGRALGLPLQRALGVRPLDPREPARGVWFVVEGLADNGNGGLHAAALGAALEVAGYLAVAPTLAPTEHAVTHMISTQLIAAAGIGDRVDVIPRLERRTRRLAFITVTAAVGTRTIASSQLTKSIVALGPS